MVQPGNYKIISYPRPDDTGGGVALVYANMLDLNKSTKYTFHAMECADIFIKHKGETNHVIIILRPPDTNILSFAEGSANLIEMNVNSPGHLIIMEDVSIHMNDSTDNNTITLNDLLDSFNCMNNILVPTKRLQNTPRWCAD